MKNKVHEDDGMAAEIPLLIFYAKKTVVYGRYAHGKMSASSTSIFFRPATSVSNGSGLPRFGPG
jgi:hypothetical protein